MTKNIIIDDIISYAKLHKRLIKEIGNNETKENLIMEYGGVAASPYY